MFTFGIFLLINQVKSAEYELPDEPTSIEHGFINLLSAVNKFPWEIHYDGDADMICSDEVDHSVSSDRSLITITIKRCNVIQTIMSQWTLSEESDSFSRKLIDITKQGIVTLSLKPDEIAREAITLELQSCCSTMYYATFQFTSGIHSADLLKRDDPKYKSTIQYIVTSTPRKIPNVRLMNQIAVKATSSHNKAIALNFGRRHKHTISTYTETELAELEDVKQGILTNYFGIRRNILEIVDRYTLLSLVPFIKTVKQISTIYKEEQLFNNLTEYKGCEEMPEIFKTLEMAPFAKAAYFVQKHQSENTDLSLDHEGRTIICTIRDFLNIDQQSVLIARTSGDKHIGFILVKKSPDTVVLSFKGTGKMDEIANDLNYHYSKALFGDFVTHKGFNDYLRVWYSTRFAEIEDVVKNYKNLIITGHSLGGSLAQLSYMLIKTKGLLSDINVSCVAFSPAPTISYIGGAFSNDDKMISWVYENDVVPQASRGSAIFLKLCVDMFSRTENASTLLLKCRNIRYKCYAEIEPLYHPGQVFHMIDNDGVFKAKSIQPEELIEIKLLPSSIRDHKIGNFLSTTTRL
ncbi:hypothetical protein ECANGB1_177 [Enterospora canceri]|uniref:sn-1-specific diacylglycerol lipase n=1 Tax=Enterospora canceri TaxID=1081671 RepID=A0A1Y1S5A3_9MICR|nr:hypothetical protein ECANGB1_177 [Enterospora canceri]